VLFLWREGKVLLLDDQQEQNVYVVSLAGAHITTMDGSMGGGQTNTPPFFLVTRSPFKAAIQRYIVTNIKNCPFTT
jgi:hypothetical protein